MVEKLFTPLEANKRLPLVKGIVNDILEKGQKIKKISEGLREEELPKEFFKLEGEIETLMGELENLGCYFKDWNFEIGLVDFPAMIDGEAVFLCWRSDEPSVQWYHPMDSGYASRKVIPEKLLV